MGVRHLQTYICNKDEVPNGFFPVNIKKEVDKWKRKNPNQQPIIVFDVLGFDPSVFFLNLGVNLCGGRHQFIVDECIKFFNRIKDLGVKLVFFKDGKVQDDKLVTWYKRQDENYKKAISILDDVYKNLNTQMIVRKHFHKINNAVNMDPLKLAISKCGGYKKSFSVECDLAIAQFACENKALAVIADDTDFLIFEGDWKYWSSSHLNHSSLTIMEYNKSALRSCLGLSVAQMPLFATVGGNDICRFDSVKPFHNFLIDKNKNEAVKGKFSLIADYVRSKEQRNYPQKLNKATIKNFCGNLFQNTNQENQDLIVKSLESYNIGRSVIVEPIKDELLSKTFNGPEGFVYEILTGITTSYTVRFFDFRKSDFKNYYELIERLILRSMGVLLKHKNDPELRRKIVRKMSHDDRHENYLVTPEYPQIEVPSLMKLLYDKNNEEMTSIRYELLAWMITDKVRPEQLTVIPEIYSSDILTLIYLLENEQISLIEVDSVLRTIYDVKNNLLPVHISTPTVIDERAMRFAFLYLKVSGLIKRCLCVVGFESRSCTQFDSLYYHKIYKNYKIEIPDDKREILSDLRLLCLAALN